MSCSTHNVLRNKSSKAIAKRYARYFARRGLKYEKRYANYNLNDARVNFLRSPEDPLHGYYKQKLSDYLSQIQTNGAIVDDDHVATTPDTSTQVIEPPPGLISDDIERTARYISKMGLVVEMFLMRARANNARYSFMWRSDPFHSFYQQKLTEYLSQSQNQQVGASLHGDASAGTDLQEEGANQDNALAALPHLAHPQPIHLPDGLEFRRPKGMNGKEFKTMKLTAQFGAWYGNDFWLGFKNRAGFEFTNPTHSNFPRFTRFVLEYSQVLKPPQDLKEKVSKNDAYLAAIHDGFFRLLQSDFLQEMEWRLGGVVSMTDWHASLDKDFPNDKEELPPGTGTGMSSPLEPEPNTQKIDEPAGLVPEEQFLAQHRGWCTIRVSVADIDGCELLVIEKTVQSLSENVASFKEKIAEEMGIPPERQVLYCKAGLLEENNKSLAQYNVGAGEILTLSLCACGRRGDMNKACRCMEMLAEALMLSMQKYELQNN